VLGVLGVELALALALEVEVELLVEVWAVLWVSS